MMTEKEYLKFMESAPDQESPAFVDFLRATNKVVVEFDRWIVVENLKFHTQQRPWYTAFHKPKYEFSDWYDDAGILWHYGDWKNWEWLKKDRKVQSVPGRFHIHIYRQ